MHHISPEQLARVARILTGIEVKHDLTDHGVKFIAVWKRQVLERLQEQVEQGIEAIDLLLGDPDLEDATDAEDDFLGHNVVRFTGTYRGPGCEISDAGGGNVDDGLERDLGDEGEQQNYN